MFHKINNTYQNDIHLQFKTSRIGIYIMKHFMWKFENPDIFKAYEISEIYVSNKNGSVIDFL